MLLTSPVGILVVICAASARMFVKRICRMSCVFFLLAEKLDASICSRTSSLFLVPRKLFRMLGSGSSVQGYGAQVQVESGFAATCLAFSAAASDFLTTESSSFPCIDSGDSFAGSTAVLVTCACHSSLSFASISSFFLAAACFSASFFSAAGFGV
jgi:hypothetical protein